MQALALVCHRILRRAEVEQDVVAAHLDGEAAQVVGPLVERTSGRQVEAGVVPVAGEDPVADRATVEREAHVWAAVVHGVDLVVLDKEANRVPVDVNDKATRRQQLGQ